MPKAINENSEDNRLQYSTKKNDDDDSSVDREDDCDAMSFLHGGVVLASDASGVEQRLGRGGFEPPR